MISMAESGFMLLMIPFPRRFYVVQGSGLLQDG